jgi:DNA polymerase-1
MRPPVLLAVDGNSLLHRSFHANARTGFRTPDGAPAWAVRGLVTQILSAVDRACADVVVVGFDDPDTNHRRQRWPHYKAQRADKLPTLARQLRSAVDVMSALGLAVVAPEGLEADDVLASAASYAPTVGARSVLVTSDRDAFALIDEHTQVLRVINGGVGGSPLLNEARLKILVGVAAGQYRDLAALRGDPSDNLPGVRGIGAATAVGLLQRFGSAAAIFASVQAEPGGLGLTGRCVRALTDPQAQSRWRTNVQIMTPRYDVPLGLHPRSGPGRLPADQEAVRAACAPLGLDARVAIRVLCELDEAPAGRGANKALPAPVVEHAGGADRWIPPPVSRTRRFGPLARTKDPQLVLF